MNANERMLRIIRDHNQEQRRYAVTRLAELNTIRREHLNASSRADMTKHLGQVMTHKNRHSAKVTKACETLLDAYGDDAQGRQLIKSLFTAMIALDEQTEW